MAKRVFFCFHYATDNWRTSQVRSIGALDGNQPVSDNDWETVKRGGDAAIQRWIDGQLSGRSCTIVLIGASTANRKWIDYEIEKSWSERKGLLGIYIHNLKDRLGQQSTMGANPFSLFKVGTQALSNIVPAYNPPFFDSRQVYSYIAANIAGWVDAAVATRQSYA